MTREIDGSKLIISDSNGTKVLTIDVKRDKQDTILILTGSITHDAAPEFEDELMSVLTSGHDVIIDFLELEYISAPVLKTLLSVQKLVEEKKCKYFIQNISEPVKKILEQTGYIDLLEIR